MKNLSSLGGNPWFWSGVILIVIGVLTAILRIRLWFSSEVVLLVIIGALVALVSKLGFRSGVILIAIGAWTAIAMLPVLFASLIVFALIGGLGLLIGYKSKRIRSTLLWGLGIASWVYLYWGIISSFNYFNTTNYYTKTSTTLLFHSLITVVPIAVLGTLVIAWLGRNKLRRPDWFYSTESRVVSAFKKLAPITLLIATPFIVAGLSDYNYRGDPNPPQVIDLKIVEKWIGHGYSVSDMETYDIPMVKGETFDGSFWFSFIVSVDFYNEHDIGSYCWVRVRNGALGYACIGLLPYGD